MKPSKNIVIAALGVFSLAVSVVAWKSYWKAAELEAASLGDDSAELRRQLAEAQKRRVVEMASTRPAVSAEEGADIAAEARPANGPGQTGGRGRGGRGGEMEAVMARPEMQRLMALQQKAALDGRYGALFKTLGLSGEKLAAFKDLLAEKEATMMDTMRVAREQGLDPRTDPEGFKKLMATTQASTNAAIKAAIGDTAYAEYEQYQATQPQRAVVSQLQQSLSYTNEPLTTAQSEQLVQVLATTATAATGEGGRGGGGRGGPAGLGGGGAGGGAGGSVVITAATVAQAQTVLSSTQMQALQDLQALQQAQQQAQKIMREAGVGGPPAGGRGEGTGGA